MGAPWGRALPVARAGARARALAGTSRVKKHRLIALQQPVQVPARDRHGAELGDVDGAAEHAARAAAAGAARLRLAPPLPLRLLRLPQSR